MARPSQYGATADAEDDVAPEAGPSRPRGLRRDRLSISTADSAALLGAASSPIRARSASTATSMNGGPILVAPLSRPDTPTRVILSSYFHLPSSAALQVQDLSVAPIGLDLPEESEETFRRQVLLSLDTLRGTLLALLALESIQLFLRADEEGDLNWYAKAGRDGHWTESPLYALRLAAAPAAPGLFVLAGTGSVLFMQSRLQLGWSRWEILQHFATRGGALMIVNLLLTYDFTVRADGPNLIENLILWTYGLVIILLGAVVVTLHSVERLAIERSQHQKSPPSDPSQRTPLLSRTTTANNSNSADSRAEKAESMAFSVGNVILLALAVGLLAMNILIVPRGQTEIRDRSYWFWWWLVPAPSRLSEGPSLPVNTQGSMISQYTPLNWLPFGLFGIVYARLLTRYTRSRLSLVAQHLLAFVLLASLFILTRFVPKFGNLTRHLVPVPSSTSRHPNNPYLASWQAFLYTCKFPPDIAYASLSLSIGSVLAAACYAARTGWKEKSPFLRFGRAPVFFYASNLLVFRFVSGFALTFFGLPPKLAIGPAVFCYFGSLAIVWFLCKLYLKFKEARSSPDSIWRAF